MIIYFKDMQSVKKDASQLRSIIKNNSDISVSINVLMDIVAKMYGWNNFNSMSHSHLRRPKNRLSKTYLPEGVSGNVFEICSLSSVERKKLEIQKHSVLMEALKDIVDYGREKIAQDYFNKKSIIEKVIDRIKGNSFARIFDYQAVMFYGLNIVIHHEKNDVESLYREIAVKNAIANGGLLVLRESIAEKILKDIEDLHSGEFNEKVKVIYANKNADKGNNGVNVNDKALFELYSKTYVGNDYSFMESYHRSIILEDNGIESLSDAIREKNIFILVIDDKFGPGDQYAKIFVQMYLLASTSYIGNACDEDLRKKLVDIKENTYYPIIFDAAERYMFDGISVVSAQSRALGYGIFYGVCTQYKSHKSPGPSMMSHDWESLTASVKNYFIMEPKGHNVADSKWYARNIIFEYSEKAKSMKKKEYTYRLTEREKEDCSKIIDAYSKIVDGEVLLVTKNRDSYTVNKINI